MEAPQPSASSSVVTELSASAPVRVVTESELGVTWHTGCPVGPEALRAVTVRHRDRQMATQYGELIVHETVVQDVLEIFEELFQSNIPIVHIDTAASREGDDDRLMADDITSAFNCRFVDGTTRWSRHASGLAIDINPFENPWVRAGGRIDPPEAARFADRGLGNPEMIRADGPVVAAFRARGWTWGGDWDEPDYQHFERRFD